MKAILGTGRNASIEVDVCEGRIFLVHAPEQCAKDVYVCTRKDALSLVTRLLWAMFKTSTHESANSSRSQNNDRLPSAR